MSRYDWPRDFRRSPDRLLHRQELNLGQRELGLPALDRTALDQLTELLRRRVFPAQTWLPLGPSILLRGQATTEPMVAGRIRDMQVNEDGTRAYAGSANGGVWYWEEGDGTWRPVGSWGLQPGMLNAGDRSSLSLTIGALTARFGRTGGADDPAGDVVYVGTGELQPRLAAIPGGRHGGIGVLKLGAPIEDVVDTPGGNPWLREANNLAERGIYRLALNPAFSLPDDPVEIVAATSGGLYFRSGAFVADAAWNEVSRSKFGHGDDDTLIFTDALWSAASGLWVTMIASSGADGLFHAPDGPTGDFTRVDLPDRHGGGLNQERYAICEPAGAGDRLYILGKRSGRHVGHSALWRVDISGASAEAKLVDKVPRAVFASTSNLDDDLFGFIVKRDQSYYDMAVTALANTGAGKDTVFVGGSAHQGSGSTTWDASLFKLEIGAADDGYAADFDETNQSDPGKDGTFIGRGIHADVHQLAHRPNGLWVACDGGIFRRDSGGDARAVNVGLAVLEPGYIDGHPTLDGSILAGLQDNAVIQRTGDTVWHRRTSGDGGGVAYHPTQPRRFVEQYTYADWSFRRARSETGFASLDPGTTGPKFADDEDSSARAYFYSKPAVAAGPTSDAAQVCLGSDRLWYSCNWGGAGSTTKWVTIPSNDDPADAVFFGGGQDKYERIRVVRFAAPGSPVTYADGTEAMDGVKVLALSGASVRLFTFSARPDDNDGDWTSMGDALISGDHPKQKYAEDDVAAPHLSYLPRPPGLAWTDVAPHSGAKGTCYVATTGKIRRPDDGAPVIVEKYDTLWWYDGEGRWYPTGLLTTPIDVDGGTAGARASAHSVIVDPDGIPEFDDPGSLADPNRHDFVYVGTKMGVWRGRLTFSETPPDSDSPRWRPTWDWEPYFDGLPQSIVEDLSFHIESRPTDGGGSKKIKLLRAAVVSRGVWELDLGPGAESVGRTYLRSYNLDTGRRPIEVMTTDPYTGRAIADHHAASPDIFAVSRLSHGFATAEWRAALPNEADLFLTGRSRALAGPPPDGSPPPAEPPRNIAYVLVHHRQIDPIDPADVTVHLFAWKNPPYEPDGTTPIPLQNLALSDDMRAAIIGTVQGGSPAMPADLAHLGSGNPTQKIDARMPRAVRIEFDLDHAFDGGRSEDTVILIAVVDSPTNHLQASDLAHPNLVEVTRRSSLVAAARFARR